MNRLFEKLLNTPTILQKLIAVIFFILALSFLALLIFLPVNLLWNKENELIDLRKRLGQFERVIAQRTDEPQKTSSKDSVLFLPGSTFPLIQAELQSKLSAQAQESSVTVLSSGPMPAIPIGSVTFIGVQINVSGTLGDIHEFLYRVENTEPVLFIRSAKLSAPRWNPASPPSDEPDIRGVLGIFGAVTPQITAKGEK